MLFWYFNVMRSGGHTVCLAPVKNLTSKIKKQRPQNSHRFQTLTPSISNSPHKCKPRIDGCRHSHWTKYAAQAVPVGRRRSKYARPCPVPRADLVLCQTYLHCPITAPPIKPWHCPPYHLSHPPTRRPPFAVAKA